MTEKKIEYGPITAKRITRNLWIAKTETTVPIKAEVTKTGKTEEEAKTNLRDWLDGKTPKKEGSHD